MAINYINVSNPAAFGTEWTHPESGSRFQLVNIRGTSELDFGMKAAGSVQWSATRVVYPSRFGLTDPPKTYSEFLAIVRA